MYGYVIIQAPPLPVVVNLLQLVLVAFFHVVTTYVITDCDPDTGDGHTLQLALAVQWWWSGCGHHLML